MTPDETFRKLDDLSDTLSRIIDDMVECLDRVSIGVDLLIDELNEFDKERKNDLL